MNSKRIRIPGLNQKCRSKTLTHMRFYWQRTLKDNHNKDSESERQLKRVCKRPTARKRRQHVWERLLTSPIEISARAWAAWQTKIPRKCSAKIRSRTRLVALKPYKNDSLSWTVFNICHGSWTPSSSRQAWKLSKNQISSILNLKLCTLTGYK